MQNLILTVGLPRSGKSTWAKRQGVPVVCPDAIRLAIHGRPFLSSAEPLVWATADLMVRSLFLAGHTDVIVDATNVTRKRRQQWANTQWTTRFRIFDTDAKTCRERAEDANMGSLIHVIDRMEKEWEPLDESERQYVIVGDLPTARG